MDAHFPSDTLVFAGRSSDQSFKADSDPFAPIVAAMSIDYPIYKWAKCAKDISNKYFLDVDISEDGSRIVAATDKASFNRQIIYIIDSLTGLVINSCILTIGSY